MLRIGIPEQYHIAGICAQSCLEGKCEKLQSGEITIEDLHHVRDCRDQMKRLCSAVSTGNSLYKSVEAAVVKRLEECEALKRRVETLSHLCRQIHCVSNKIQGMGIYCMYGEILVLQAHDYAAEFPSSINTCRTQGTGG